MSKGYEGSLRSHRRPTELVSHRSVPEPGDRAGEQHLAVCQEPDALERWGQGTGSVDNIFSDWPWGSKLFGTIKAAGVGGAEKRDKREKTRFFKSSRG